jgi:hypothetical protein
MAASICSTGARASRWEPCPGLPTDHFVNGLAFDARSKVLAAALHDGTVKIWAAE